MNDHETRLLDMMETAVAEMANGDREREQLLEQAFFRVCTFLDGVQCGQKRLKLLCRKSGESSRLLHDEWTKRRWACPTEDLSVPVDRFAALFGEDEPEAHAPREQRTPHPGPRANGQNERRPA